MSRPSRAVPALLLAAAALAAGCQPARISGGNSGGSGPGAGGNGATGAGAPGGSAGSPAPTGGVPGLNLPDAGPGGANPTPPPAMTCATDVHRAEKVPLDLLLLVDTSDSMNQLSGMQSKWQLTRQALRSFVEDPGSQGLGVGLQFFPASAPPVQARCQQDIECAAVSGTAARPCRKLGWCFAPGLPVLTNRPCAPGLVSPFNCPAGMTCQPQGLCPAGGAACVAGAPCEGGGACQITPGSCAVIGGGCNRSQYEQLAVPIAPLPGQAGALATALAAREPDGQTPMTVAADATLSALAARAAAQPGRRAALVLATDGLPTGCGNGETIDGVVARLQQARASTPAIPTYVVGVFAAAEVAEARPALERFATAGGTGTPFILATGQDLGQRLLEALQEIRGLAVACDYALPAAQAGAIDINKVNVRTTSQGQPADLGYVGAADRCTDRGGWYYDPPPGMGTRPARLVLCPASCARLRGDPAAQVDLVFGCATRTIE
jgi:hypothetical protein